MKSDREDRVYVVLPMYFKHGKSALLWALLNVAKNGERLFIVHVHHHKHISRKGVEKKLGDYVSMCNARKVSCDLKIIKNGHVAKALAELIDREGITKLVMQGAADKRYSEGMKSLESKTAIKLMKTAPLTCKIWFTCNGQLICTREANATVPAIQPPPVDSLALKKVKEKNDQQSAMTLPAETNTEFSKYEIQEAMQCFGNTPIGKGRSGSVYKGRLRNTDVAIKILDRGSIEGEFDFNQKVAVLGRVRHPNLVTLMGVCREVFGLVYEFLPNGSLQDQLVACRNGMSSPLKWQVRIKIIREIWTVLTFLHLSKPPLVHGNLKASKVLLDSIFTCKLEASAGIFQSIGTPTATEDDDMHSFGIIALQLLMTWLSPENDNVVKVVDEANKKGELDTVLKTTAGDWPTELAKRLAHIGLRCVGISGGLESPAGHPPDDLAEEVRQLFVAADRFAAASQDEAEAQAPDHFRCPISNVLMVDPHIAADGHTYERKDIDTWWFSYGKDTSPVTGEVIADKRLILNRAIKLMIENWKEEQQRQVRPTLTVCDPNPVQSSLHPDPVTSRSLTPLDTSAEAQLQLQPPPASSSPPTTLISPATDARSGSTAPLNTSAASARSHRLNPLAANPSAAAPPPPRPVSPSSTDFLPPPTGIRRRRVNGRLLSSSTEPDVPAGPGETSRIRGKFKHQ